MPVFHTKTIEKILEPVADQVSQLIILHEAGEGGAGIPILTKPIGAVKSAVTTLSTVGLEQIKKTGDEVLKMDTPPAIKKLESSADLLLDASACLSADEYSKIGREKLIFGARGILQGTSDLLLVFDEAEVRRICQVCQSIRDYLKISNAIQMIEDLITYVKNLTLGMTNMSKLVLQRSKNLTNSVHAEKMEAEIDTLKTNLPNLISSMKAQLSIIQEGNSRQLVAGRNDEIYVKRLSDGITEIIRILQLVSTDQEAVLDKKNMLQFHEVRDNITGNMQKAHAWINNIKAEIGSAGSFALYRILDDARTIGLEVEGATGKKISLQCDGISKMANSLTELKNQPNIEKEDVEQLQQQMHQSLDNLLQDGYSALQQLDVVYEAQNIIASSTPIAKEWLFNFSATSSCGTNSVIVENITNAARTIADVLAKDSHEIKHLKDLLRVSDEVDTLMEEVKDYRIKNLGNLPEARLLSKQVSNKVVFLNNTTARIMAKNTTPFMLEDLSEDVNGWLKDIESNDYGRGIMAARNVVFEARVLAAETKDAETQKMLLQKTIECEKLFNDLDDLQRSGLGDSPEACKIASEFQTKFDETKDIMKDVLVKVVADEYSDTTTILQQFTNATRSAKSVQNRDKIFQDKAIVLNKQTQKLANLGHQVTAISLFRSKEKSQAVLVAGKKVTDLTQQVISAGKVVLEFPENKEAQEHFRAVQTAWTENVGDLTEQVDDCVDAAKFFKASQEDICQEYKKCEMAMKNHLPQLVLPAAGTIVQKANRMLMIGRHELENTDEDQYICDLSTNLNAVTSIINPMVQATRAYAQDPSSKLTQDCWKNTNKNLINAVSRAGKTIEAKLSKDQVRLLEMQKQEDAPPRPPLPSNDVPPPRPPLPEVPFPEEDGHEMMQAARGLHEEATKWTSKGSDIIVSAKKMALLMAEMSCLVRDGDGKKCDLINCAQEIAKSSSEVTRFSSEVIEKCTDKRIQIDLKKTLDRIPTISTQLRILSTVKAASLGDSTNMTKDEAKAAEQATEMLVHNAQNLMMSVKDTVRYCEAASIRIRMDAGDTMQWTRR